MILKFVDGVEVLHNKYLTRCNFSYLQDFELWEGKKCYCIFVDFTFEAYSALSCSLELEQLLIFNWDLLFWPLNQHGKIKCFKAKGEPFLQVRNEICAFLGILALCSHQGSPLTEGLTG